MTAVDKYESYKRHVSGATSTESAHRYWSDMHEKCRGNGCFSIGVGSEHYSYQNAMLHKSNCSKEQWAKIDALVLSIIEENKEKTFVDFIASVKESVKGIEAEVLGE